MKYYLAIFLFSAFASAQNRTIALQVEGPTDLAEKSASTEQTRLQNEILQQKIQENAIRIAQLQAQLAASRVPTCVIIRHASTARQFLVSGANWQFVEGDFPKGMKWKSNVTDRTVRKIKEMDGKVVIVPKRRQRTAA